MAPFKTQTLIIRAIARNAYNKSNKYEYKKKLQVKIINEKQNRLLINDSCNPVNSKSCDIVNRPVSN